MSGHYVPVSWTRSKIVYDVVLILSVAAFLLLFRAMAHRTGVAVAPLDDSSLSMRMYGECALLLLTFALAIGPLARLDKRFLPLLYNRRHLGVLTFTIVAAHAWAVFDWYFVYSPLHPLLALLASDAAYGNVRNFPFTPFGLAAALILATLAATSHDFWLKLLGPGLWKRLHLAIYPAYGLVVSHLAFGALQSAQNLALPLMVMGAVALLIGLHCAAALKDRRAHQLAMRSKGTDNWIRVGAPGDIPVSRALIVHIPDGDPVAVFNDNGMFSALANRCAHQNGPLGEGRVINSCVVCPWHGYEYQLSNGRAPPPHTERVATYPLRVSDGVLFLDPRPDPQDRPSMPISVRDAAHE